MRKARKTNRKTRRSSQSEFNFEKLELRKLMATVGFEPAIYPQPYTGEVVMNDVSAQDSTSDGLNQRIVNGEQTDGYEAVGYVGPLGCTGTLISPTHVLTAAHCLEGVGNAQATFEVNGETFQSSSVTIHPDYNPNDFGAGNDVAIIELNRPVNGVQPMDINRTRPQVGTMLTLVGFGEGGTSTGGYDPNDTGKQVGQTELEVVTDEHISWNFDSHDEANTAPGDSGGPAFINSNGQLLIAGVTSGGEGDAHSLGDFSFDTRIDVHQDWIDGIVGSDGGGGGGGGGTGGGQTGDDHADNPGPDATRINLNQSGNGVASGSLETVGDRDAFQFQISESGKTVISLQGVDGLDTYLRLYNSSGNLIAANDDVGSTLDSRIIRDLGQGTYYITAGSYDDAYEGEFNVSVRHEAFDTGGNGSGGLFENNTPQEISEYGTDRIHSNLHVSGLSGTITDLNVEVDIDHTWVSDLRLVLVAPNGNRLVLVAQQGDDGNNFENTVFDQQASQHINRGDAPFRGSFRPLHSLNRLNGMNPNGRWRLVVLDRVDQDGGQLNSWSLDFETEGTRSKKKFANRAMSQEVDKDDMNIQGQRQRAQNQATTLSLAGSQTSVSQNVLLPHEFKARQLSLVDAVFSEDLFEGLDG